MTFVIILPVLFIFSFLEILLKNKKIKMSTIYLIICSILFFIFAFNRQNADYDAYIRIFEGRRIAGETEFGYLKLIEVVKFFSGNHNWIIILTAILFFFIFTYKIKIYYRLTFLFLYYISNFLYDINQIRNILMTILIYLGFYFFEKKKKITCVLLILLGISFHRLAILYLVFVSFILIFSKNYIKYIKKIIVLVFVFTPFTPIFFKFFIEFISSFFFKEKIIYLKGVNLGYLVSIFQVILDIIVINILYRNHKYKKKIYYKLILFTFLFLPISFLSKEIYTRIYRFSLFGKWYFVLNSLKYEKLDKRLLIYILLVLNAGISLTVMYFRSPEFIIPLAGFLSNYEITF